MEHDAVHTGTSAFRPFARPECHDRVPSCDGLIRLGGPSGRRGALSCGGHGSAVSARRRRLTWGLSRRGRVAAERVGVAVTMLVLLAVALLGAV